MPVVGSLLILVFSLYCLLDVLMTDADAVRNLPRFGWTVLIVFLPVMGGAAWLLAGRPPRPRPGGQVAATHPSPGHRDRHPTAGQRPRGPDDDPDFLRALEERIRREGDSDEHPR